VLAAIQPIQRIRLVQLIQSSEGFLKNDADFFIFWGQNINSKK